MSVINALEAAGRNVTRESLVDALEKLNFKPDITAGPIVFGKDRRDGLRDVFVIKFDGKTQTPQPGIYSWNGKDGS